MTLGPRAAEKGQHSSCGGLAKWPHGFLSSGISRATVGRDNCSCCPGLAQCTAASGRASSLGSSFLHLPSLPSGACGLCHMEALLLPSPRQPKPGTMGLPLSNADSTGASEEGSLLPHSQLLTSPPGDIRVKTETEVWC